MNRSNVIIIIFSVLIALLALSLWYTYLTKEEVARNDVTSYTPFSPISGGSGGGNVTSTKSNGAPQTTQEQKQQQATTPVTSGVLDSVTAAPAGGGGFAGKEQKTVFIDRAKGTIYSIRDTKAPERISNVTIPGISDFSLDTLGTTALLKTATTPVEGHVTITSIAPQSGEKKNVPITLPDDVIDAVIADKLYFFARNETGGATLYSADTDGEERSTLWTSTLTNWTLRNVSPGTLEIATKASNDIPGISFLFGVSKKEIVPLFTDMPGLMTLISPKQTYVLYTTASQSTIQTKIKSLVTGEEMPLQRAVLPEKCAWAHDESFILCGVSAFQNTDIVPDTWYQGATTLTDTLQRIDPATGAMDTVTQEESAPIDVERPEIDSENKTLLFVDKKTGLLWTLSI